jgi:hypothetical protein
MIIRSFILTLSKLRDLEASLRQGGMSRSDCVFAVKAVKRWLQREAEVPETTPSESVVPDERVHP